jgi:SAM-dependent methyltransferase
MIIDEILEKFSMSLPFGLGKAHHQAVANSLDGSIQSCLDIGCGRGAFEFLKDYQSIGCDIYKPVLQKASEKGYYTNLIQCDVRQLPFGMKSFDAAICIEVIEHLGKEEGLEFLKQLEGIARKRVIVATPWGYFPLKEREDNPYLNHLSGWLPEEFEAMGYKVYPFYYSRYPKGSHIHQILTRFMLTLLMYPLIKRYPDKFAQDFIAVKNLQ